MTIFIKNKSRRYVTVNKRDYFGLNALERVRLKEISGNIVALLLLHSRFRYIQVPIITAVISEYVDMLRILIVDIPVRQPRVVYTPMTFALMESELHRLNVSCRFYESLECFTLILYCLNFISFYFSGKQFYWQMIWT